jgi:hypothetical protein
MKEETTPAKKNRKEQPQTYLPYDIHKPINPNTELIFSRIESSINSGLFAPPSSFMKGINQLGFSTPKDFVIGVIKPMTDKLKGMSFKEGMNIDLNDIISSVMSVFEGKSLELTDQEKQEYNEYQNSLFKMIIQRIARDIRAIKQSGYDADKELRMVLDFMSNFATDSKYMYDVDILKEEIPYLKNEIEKPIRNIFNSIPVTTPLSTSETTISHTKTKATQQKGSLKSKKSNSYSHKQIAIAYSVMDITISKENAGKILKEHSTLKSTDKLIQKRINRPSELTKLSENKTVDSKHLKDLYEAERLIMGKKNEKAKAGIKLIIKAFETSYQKTYNR